MNGSPSVVIVSGVFDNLAASSIRFLEEASRFGPLTVRLWSDNLAREKSGVAPKFPAVERQYCLNAIRFVHRVEVIEQSDTPESLKRLSAQPGLWVVPQAEESHAVRDLCRVAGWGCHELAAAALKSFPPPPMSPGTSVGKKVIVTGSFDWLHSGHVRFFEEASSYGELYVVVGHDANIQLLKGVGHPLFPEQERRYVVGSIRFVKQALVSTGHGWLDADPEIQQIRPDIYAVNEDGDKGGKREYCAQRGIQYLVLKRTPAAGLPARSSTGLRGF